MAQNDAAADEELVTKMDPAIDKHEYTDENNLEFLKSAMEEVRSMLESNRADADRMGMDVEKTVDDVLEMDNIETINIRAKPFENPRVTVWLSDAPNWANTADTVTHYPEGINAYNGKVSTTIDVRPF